MVIRFNERISERLTGVSDLADAVLVSPATSPVKVERHRRSIEVSLVRGWQPGRVYRVVVQPVYSDLFGNARQEPIDLVFSTGAPIPETAVAGFVEDGLTLEPVAGARIEAMRRPDSTPYVAATDTAGFFALRYVPTGEYDIRAWLDQDGDREADFREAQDTADLAIGSRDTTIMELALLPRDSTPPVLARATAIDSTKIRLAFDDFFQTGPVAGTAVVYDTLGTRIPIEGRLLHGSRLDSLLAVERARADSLRALTADSAGGVAADSLRPPPLDTLRGDTLPRERIGVDSMIAPPGRPAPDTGGVAVTAMNRRAGPPRPSRDLVLVLQAPLPPGPYRVEVRGVVNIRGLTGGGTVRLEMPEPATPEPAAGAAADTAVGGGGAVR